MRIGLQAWDSEGDIKPFTALAAGLTEVGHDVTLVVTDNANRDYSPAARRFGFQLVPVPIPQAASPAEEQEVWRRIIELENPVRQAELIMQYGFDPGVEAMYAAARELCSENEAVIGHFFVNPLRVAAERDAIPMATVNIVHNCLPSAYINPPVLPKFGSWFYPLGWKLVRTMVNRVFLPRVNDLRARAGLRPDEDVMRQTWSSELLNLIAVSPSICQRPPDWEPRHQVCGFLNLPIDAASEPLANGLADFLDAGDPPVYITFGSMMPRDFQYIKETVGMWTAGIREVGCRSILQVPWDDLGLFRTGDGIFKVQRAPYRQVFPRCSMVVHHGGAGTTQSSLLAARPSLVIAHVADQAFWGSELERLGVAGRTLKRSHLTARKLAREVQGVLASPTMADRARNLASSMVREDGVASAVRLIEERVLRSRASQS